MKERKFIKKDARNTVWVKIRYSAVIYMAINRLTKYKIRLPNGKTNNQIGAAS